MKLIIITNHFRYKPTQQIDFCHMVDLNQFIKEGYHSYKLILENEDLLVNIIRTIYLNVKLFRKRVNKV